MFSSNLFFRCFLSDAEAQREFDEKQELNNIELNRYVNDRRKKIGPILLSVACNLTFDIEYIFVHCLLLEKVRILWLRMPVIMLVN